MSEVRPDFASLTPPTDRELLMLLIRDVAMLRLAVEAIRTDMATLLNEREPEAPPDPEPRPLRAGGGAVMYWPRVTEAGRQHDGEIGD